MIRRWLDRRKKKKEQAERRIKRFNDAVVRLSESQESLNQESENTQTFWADKQNGNA